LYDSNTVAYAVVSSCTTVATLIETFALLVGIALCVGALISSARAREFGGVIFCAIFAAVLAAALVGLLLHPAEVQQQAEKPEG
jgi:ABC-type transport system involved in cytochrome c biogenesis permease subunit